MKEMIYSGNGKSELLRYETDGEYALAVVNTHGSHPCGYIQFPNMDRLKGEYEVCIENEKTNEWVDVHGGFTFLGTLNHLGLEGTWLGWDYAHLDDWTQSVPVDEDVFPHRDEKKWTTEEVVEEAREALRILKEPGTTIVVD